MIYADHAATTPLSPKAYEAMSEFFTKNYGNASQPYGFAKKAKSAIEKSRAIIAECINAHYPEEILFTSCGTESNNWILHTFLGKEIITSSIEHHAILNFCNHAEKIGTKVIYLPVSNKGEILTETLKKIEIESGSLVSVMMVNNEVGTVQSVANLAEIAHEKNCLYHTDAVQAMGHLHIDVNKIFVDYLSASAHKFNGPKGIGFLYVKKGSPIKPFIYGGSQEYGLRAGTENVAFIVAMAIALKENIESLDETNKHLKKLEIELIENLNKYGIKYVRNGVNQIPGNLSLSFPGVNGEGLLHSLDLMGVCISTGSACDSKRTQMSHVLKAMDIKEDLAYGTIRISLGKDNTKEEIGQIANAINKIVAKSRN